MSKKAIGYLSFFIVLTAFFLFFVFAGTDNWRVKLPVLSDVKPFSFLNQQGTVFTEKNMEGKVCVVNFFFTTCKGICPRMNGNLYEVYNEFKNEKDFMIVSHTSDPERDSVQRLKWYADSMKVDNSKWIFLTGRKDSLYYAARNSYLLDDPKNNVEKIEDQFLHTQFIALVDKHGNIRSQIFDGLKKDDLSELRKGIKKLLEEN
jgi:protein SCO1